MHHETPHHATIEPHPLLQALTTLVHKTRADVMDVHTPLEMEWSKMMNGGGVLAIFCPWKEIHPPMSIVPN